MSRLVCDSPMHAGKLAYDSRCSQKILEKIQRLLLNACMEYREASPADTKVLAHLNQQLIRDEGHRNPMTLAELEVRLDKWLRGEYQAVLFEQDRETVGYALFREDSEYVYLRQFFVATGHRRKGLGRQAIEWLSSHRWQDAPRVRVEVLIGNEEAVAFWRAVGFVDYCLILERQ